MNNAVYSGEPEKPPRRFGKSNLKGIVIAEVDHDLCSLALTSAGLRLTGDATEELTGSKKSRQTRSTSRQLRSGKLISQSY
jgi:hypothetical protein